MYIKESNLKFTNYTNFLLSLGFTKRKRVSKFLKYKTFDDLCMLWDEYYLINGKYPDGSLIRKRNDFPDIELVKCICGDRYREFRVKYKMKIVPQKSDYDSYCKIFINESNKLGEPLKSKDLDTFTIYSYLLPSTRWFINNSPYEEVKCYNSFLEKLGFKPKYMISKELAIKMIHEKVKELGRNPMASDFQNHEHLEELGIQTIKNHWGTFNKMLIDLDYEINWQSFINLKPLKEMEKDILTLCQLIHKEKGRKVIGYNDIDDSEFCFNSNIYSRKFQQEFNMTLAEYINSIGYIANEAGKGMKFKYDDGELTRSQFEFIVSDYLRDKGLKYNIDYTRDVYYKRFIDSDYKGNKNIDYIVFDKWYIEVAGVVIRDEINHKSRKSILNYKNNLKDKIKMLEDAKLDYQIIYPDDLKRPLDEVFSFLFAENKKAV